MATLVATFLNLTSNLVTGFDRLIVNRTILDIGQYYFQVGPCKLVYSAPCSDGSVQFILFTRANPSIFQRILVGDNESLSASFFNPEDPTKVIIHGYNSNVTLSYLVDIKQEYLKRGSYNILMVDWSKLSQGPCYPVAVYNVQHVGKCVAQLVGFLRSYGAEDIHLVGFSVGAHVAGSASNYMEEARIDRITGLDPALPLFFGLSNSQKLDASDAEFVDVIHTDAFRQGKFEASGHADFYVNGGSGQTGCEAETNPSACDHHRSVSYFAESINTELGFWSRLCSGWISYQIGTCSSEVPLVPMGEHCPPSAKGTYFLSTASSPPYALGNKTIYARVRL